MDNSNSNPASAIIEAFINAIADQVLARVVEKMGKLDNELLNSHHLRIGSMEDALHNVSAHIAEVNEKLANTPSYNEVKRSIDDAISDAIDDLSIDSKVEEAISDLNFERQIEDAIDSAIDDLRITR